MYSIQFNEKKKKLKDWESILELESVSYNLAFKFVWVVVNKCDARAFTNCTHDEKINGNLFNMWLM